MHVSHGTPSWWGIGQRRFIICRSRHDERDVTESQRVDGASKTGLAIRSLILVNHAGAGGLVKLLSGELVCFLGSGLIASGDGFAGATDDGLQAGLHRHVALVRLLVGQDALLLRLDVCQCNSKRRLL